MNLDLSPNQNFWTKLKVAIWRKRILQAFKNLNKLQKKIERDYQLTGVKSLLKVIRNIYIQCNVFTWINFCSMDRSDCYISEAIFIRGGGKYKNTSCFCIRTFCYFISSSFCFLGCGRNEQWCDSFIFWETISFWIFGFSLCIHIKATKREKNREQIVKSKIYTGSYKIPYADFCYWMVNIFQGILEGRHYH